MNRGIFTVFGVAVFFAILFGSLTFETVMAKPNSNSSADSGVCHFDNTDTQMWEALWVNSKGQMKAHVNVHGDETFTTDAEAAWCVTNQDGTIVEPAVCGDNITTPPETCDEGEDNGSRPGLCNATCDGTVPAVCGDTLVTPPEECDDGNTEDGDGCSQTCELQDLEPVCGDGVMEGAEECDDGNNSDGDGCNAVCVVEFCNDGIKNDAPNEQCDGADLDGMFCPDFDPDGFNLEVNLLGNRQGNVKGSIDGVEPSLFCNSDCTFDFTQCGFNGFQ